MSRAPYAADPAASRGREFAQAHEGSRGPRSAFQRDRDRIIHSIAFRRLRRQDPGVHRARRRSFPRPADPQPRGRADRPGDRARAGARRGPDRGACAWRTTSATRRSAMRARRRSTRALAPRGGFDHNEHTLRVLMRLDSPYCEHDRAQPELGSARGAGQAQRAGGRAGLGAGRARRRLSARSGALALARGAGRRDRRRHRLRQPRHRRRPARRASSRSTSCSSSISWPSNWRAVERRFPGAPREALLRELVREPDRADGQRRARRPRAADLPGIGSVDEVRAAGRAARGFSPAMAAHERELKRFLYGGSITTPSSSPPPSARAR